VSSTLTGDAIIQRRITNDFAGRINVLVNLFRQCYEDSNNPDFPKWLKEHSSRIRKLTGEEENEYYIRIQDEVLVHTKLT